MADSWEEISRSIDKLESEVRRLEDEVYYDFEGVFYSHSEKEHKKKLIIILKKSIEDTDSLMSGNAPPIRNHDLISHPQDRNPSQGF